MEILIVVPKYNLSKKKCYTYNFPMGLAYISAVLKKEKYSVDCVNLNHYDGTIEELMNKILNKKKYDFILTGGNALMFSVIKSISYSTHKHKSRPKIILGGPIITSEPELMVHELKPNFAVIGEGEITIIELLKSIKNNKNLKKVDGIIYQDKIGDIIKTKPRMPIHDIDSLPLPDYAGMSFEKQLKHMHSNDHNYNHPLDYPRTYTLLTSRGCPFNCTFCWHPVKYRKRSLNKIMDELRIMTKKYKINNIVIYDDCFSIDKEWLYEFCKKIKKLSKELSVKLTWFCALVIGTVDGDLLKIMKDAGCHMIGYGFESFSPIVLKSMRKPVNVEQMDKGFKATLKAGIANHSHLIFGDIAETRETAKETIKHWKRFYHGQVGLSFVQPYPGSQIYKYCIEKGIIKDKMNYIQNDMGPHNPINMTKMLNKEHLRMRKNINKAYSKYMKFIIPLSVKKMGDKIYEVTFKCPYCRKKTVYKNFYIKNKLSYGYYITCRNCPMRFFIVSFFQKVGYKYYAQLRDIKTKYNLIKKSLMRKTI